MPDSPREAKIQSYGRAHDYLTQALKKYPREMWQFKPAPEEWSIHEIIIHLSDSEANSYVRCRRFLAEPGLDLMAYDEVKWARELQYHDQSPEDAVELFKWLHKKSCDLISRAPDEVWSRECFHPEDGTITMRDWLDTYERHVAEHVVQMDEVFKQWKKKPDRAR